MQKKIREAVIFVSVFLHLEPISAFVQVLKFRDTSQTTIFDVPRKTRWIKTKTNFRNLSPSTPPKKKNLNNFLPVRLIDKSTFLANFEATETA